MLRTDAWPASYVGPRASPVLGLECIQFDNGRGAMDSSCPRMAGNPDREQRNSAYKSSTHVASTTPGKGNSPSQPRRYRRPLANGDQLVRARSHMPASWSRRSRNTSPPSRRSRRNNDCGRGHSPAGNSDVKAIIQMDLNPTNLLNVIFHPADFVMQDDRANRYIAR